MLYDHQGNRKYLTAEERRAFIATAELSDPYTSTFCLTLAYTGARISEVLALTPRSIDFSTQAIVIRCLKRRREGVFRTLPVPSSLLDRLEGAHGVANCKYDASRCDERLWTWCRTTAWARVKAIMADAGVEGAQAIPKGLRHGLCVEGTTDAGIPLNVMQRWLGHARLETTAIYANVTGREERRLISRTW